MIEIMHFDTPQINHTTGNRATQIYLHISFKRAKLIHILHGPDLVSRGVIKQRRDIPKGEAPQSALTSENLFQHIHRHEMFDLGSVQALVLSKLVSRHIDIIQANVVQKN